MNKIKERLSFIYDNQDVELLWTSIQERINRAKARSLKPRKQSWDEKDIVLITYGDQFYENGKATLSTFKEMFDKYFQHEFDIVHLLPFYPYSSDDGFSVTDYKSVNPLMGNWDEIESLSKSTRIMFDDVCNHVSAQSEWFQEYLQGNPKYQNYFLEMDPSLDLSAVTRPRALPLLTKFTLANGEEKYIWTTFSDDQIDLNFGNPQVLLKMIDVLLFYVEQGAEYIRLDAIGFLWKEPGTSCFHHVKTHEIVKLFRDIVDEVAKGTVIITETNVAHRDNVAYFGNGHDEAHMVYQFPLPPLVLNAIHNGNGSALANWASQLPLTGNATTFFNFLASHDGIGLNPIRGIIPEEEILAMVEDLKREGALVNYKKNPDGTESPYEINVTYLDALNKQSDDDDLRVKRFLAAHSILLTLSGVPAVYIQSMLGSRNYHDGVLRTGMNRTINRQKYRMSEIERELTNPDSLRYKVLTQLAKLIQARKREALFHPNAAMKVIDLGAKVFAYERVNEQNDKILVLNNLANEEVSCGLTGEFINVLDGEKLVADSPIRLEPYQFVWLKPVTPEQSSNQCSLPDKESRRSLEGILKEYRKLKGRIKE